MANSCHTRGRCSTRLLPQDIEQWPCLLALPNSMASVFRIPADLQVFSAGCQTSQVISRVALTGETNSRSLKVLDFHVSRISRDPKWSYNHACEYQAHEGACRMTRAFFQARLTTAEAGKPSLPPGVRESPG